MRFSLLQLDGPPILPRTADGSLPAALPLATPGIRVSRLFKRHHQPQEHARRLS
jgi:hypothetical protein